MAREQLLQEWLTLPTSELAKSTRSSAQVNNSDQCCSLMQISSRAYHRLRLHQAEAKHAICHSTVSKTRMLFRHLASLRLQHSGEPIHHLEHLRA